MVVGGAEFSRRQGAQTAALVGALFIAGCSSESTPYGNAEAAREAYRAGRAAEHDFQIESALAEYQRGISAIERARAENPTFLQDAALKDLLRDLYLNSAGLLLKDGDLAGAGQLASKARDLYVSGDACELLRALQAAPRPNLGENEERIAQGKPAERSLLEIQGLIITLATIVQGDPAQRIRALEVHDSRVENLNETAKYYEERGDSAGAEKIRREAQRQSKAILALYAAHALELWPSDHAGAIDVMSQVINRLQNLSIDPRDTHQLERSEVLLAAWLSEATQEQAGGYTALTLLRQASRAEAQRIRNPAVSRPAAIACAAALRSAGKLHEAADISMQLVHLFRQANVSPDREVLLHAGNALQAYLGCGDCPAQAQAAEEEYRHIAEALLKQSEEVAAANIATARSLTDARTTALLVIRLTDDAKRAGLSNEMLAPLLSRAQNLEARLSANPLLKSADDNLVERFRALQKK